MKNLRNVGTTPEQRRNNAGTTERGTPAEWLEYHRTTAEYWNNGTPQKVEPEDRHGIFHYFQFSLALKAIRAMSR